MAIQIHIYSDNQVFDETISDRYIIKSLQRDDQLTNGLESSSSTRKFSLTRNCPYTLPILSWNGKDDDDPPNEDSIDLHADIIDGNSVLFTGYLSDKVSWGIDTHGAETLTLTIEDMGTHLLKNPYTKNVSSLIEGTFSQCLNTICTAAGVTVSSDVPAISTNVSCVADSGETCESLLKALCKEFGYAYYFESDGELNLKELSFETLDTTPVVDDTELYDSITLNKKARQYRGSRIEWKKIAQRTDALIYRDITNQTTSHPECWIELNLRESYPANTPTDIKAVDLKQGSEVYAISNVRLTDAGGNPSVVWDRGDGVNDIQQHGADSLRVMLTCISTGGFDKGVISKLQAYATLKYIESNEVVYGNSEHGSENLYESECRWIHDSDSATKYANFCAQYWQYSSNSFTFKTKRNFSLGQIIRLHENVYTGLATYLMIQKIRSDGVSDVKTYEAVSTSEFDYEKDTDTESLYIPPTDTYVEVPDFTEIEEEIKDFRLYVNPYNYVADRRRTDNQELHFSTTIKGYTGTPTIKYWFGDTDPDDPVVISAEAVTLFLPYNHSHPSLIVTAELAGAPTQRVIMTTIDETEEYRYYGELDIDTSDYYDASGQIVPSQYNLVDWTSIDDLLESNEQFIDGDSFFNNHTEQGFTDVYIYVYQVGQWIPISSSNFSNSVKSSICMKAQKEVLSTIEAGSVTKSDFGYFNTIIAGTVTAEYIGGKEIEVHDGGFIYAGDVDITEPAGSRVGQTGAGFCFDSIGNAEMANIRITGDSTIEGGSTVLGTLINYDTVGNPVFRTVKETNARVSMSGSKVDGTSNPSAYLWNSFTTWLRNWITSRATEGTYYSASGSVVARWNGSSLSSNSITGIRYWASVPTSGTSFTVNGDRGAGTVETKTMYTNPNAYNMVFSELAMHPKTDQSIWGVIGYGELKVTTYTSGGSVYQVLCNQGEKEGNYGVGMAYAYNVVVPPGGYIVAEAGTYSGHPWGQWDSDLYIKFSWSESNMFYDGINFILPNGSVYAFNSIMPTESSFSVSSQSLTCSGLSLSLNMSMTAGSSWPVEKYYSFSYTQSPGTSTTITTSIFDSQSFTYRGVSKTIASITFNNSMLKIIDTNGQAYEFYTSAGYYYPRHTFSIVTLGEELGAYMRSALPTDDALTHNIGASTNYDSGNPQRWNTGFFTTLDVSQGIHAQTVNAGWVVPIITSSTSISADDFTAVGQMRPYFINSSGTITLTMPGNSSQQYIVIEHNVVVMALVSAGKVNRYEAVNGGSSLSFSVTSSAEPYLLIHILRIA